MLKNTKILGVRIDNLSVGEIKEKISAILENTSEQKFVTTLNPEILLKAHRDENYRNILNNADLNVCDGFGLRLVGFFRKKFLKARLAGADLVFFLLEEANQKKMEVLVIAAEKSLCSPAEIEQSIGEKYPDLSAKAEYFLPSQGFSENAIIKSAEIVFVNFGAPDQERFISQNRAKFPRAKILVGVGGTFDFLTGKIRRAPRIFRFFGLEWLWRLSQEPKRIKRIWKAVVVFSMVATFKDK